MTVRHLLAGLALALLAAGCSNTNPVQPSASVPLSALAIVPAGDTLHAGDTAAFTVAALDTNGAVVANPVVSWSSGNTAVFRVSSRGIVTAVAEGSAQLSAASGGRVATAAVLVLPAVRGWYRLATVDPTVDLNAVWFDAQGNSGWAVGTLGRVLHTTNAGATWTAQASNTGFTLNSVWFTSAAEGWAAGAGGTVMHTTDAGATWSRVTVPTAFALYGITFATPDTGWAVGANGTILRTFDGGTTWADTSVSAATLRGVAFANSSDGWAVGDNGTIAGTHDGGRTWFRVLPSPTAYALYAVAHPTAAAAVAVGTLGAAPRTVATPDSAAWTLVTAPAPDLRGVRFVDATHGWAVGRNGNAAVLVTTDGGASWAPQVAFETNLLRGVWFVDGMRGWAVGDNGTVLHTATGGEP